MFIMSRLSVIDLANFYALKYIHLFIFFNSIKNRHFVRIRIKTQRVHKKGKIAFGNTILFVVRLYLYFFSAEPGIFGCYIFQIICPWLCKCLILCSFEI